MLRASRMVVVSIPDGDGDVPTIFQVIYKYYSNQ
jgi:hypothetical protein